MEKAEITPLSGRSRSRIVAPNHSKIFTVVPPPEPKELCISLHTEQLECCSQDSIRMYRQEELCLGRSGLGSHK